MSIFDRICDLPPDEQSEALDAHCDGDEALRERVERMLAAEHDDRAVLADSNQGAGALILAGELTETTPNTEFPARIGRYKIHREIGRGGMGVVYEAEQENPNRTVALKILPPGFGNPAVLRRFQREADILGRMRHPGITQIFEAGIAEMETALGITARQPFIAMELIPGVPLDRYARENVLSIDERLRLFTKICDAIQHAHDNGVIHRDLKPNNILVERNGQPKILDFGVSRATRADMLAVSLQTHTGQIVGTIPYMSPEQVQGDPEAVDERTDVYSLGVVLYELLSGQLPHDLRDRPIIDAIRVIQEEEPSRLGSVDRSFRGDIDTILCKSLEKEKDRRYISPAAFADDIRRYFAHEPLQARPVSSLYQFRKFARRNKALVIGAVATMAACLIGTVVATIFAIQAQHSSRLASEREIKAQKASYRASISAAAAAVREYDIATAERHLRAAPDSLRSWDWHYLSSRLDQSLSVISFDPGLYNIRDPARGRIHVWFSADRRLIHRAKRHYSTQNRKPLIVQTIDANSLQVIASWSEDEIYCFAPNLNGEALLVASQDNTASLRNTLDGELIQRIPTRANAKPRFRGFIPQQIPNSILDAWDAQFHQTLINGDSPTRAVASPDGRRVVCWHRNNVSLYDNKTLILTIPPEQHPEGVSNAVFSPDGRHLVTTGLDRRLAMYHVDEGGRQVWMTSDAHRDAILAVAYSPCGAYLVTGGEDRILKVWDAQTGRLRSTMIGHRNPILDVSFSMDGMRLVSASADRVHIWSMESSDDVLVMKGHEWIVQALAISPDGSMLVSNAKDTLFWDVQSGALIARLHSEKNSRSSTVSFSPDGRRLLVGATVIDLTSGETLAELKADKNKNHQYDPTGRFIIGNTWKYSADSLAVLSEHARLATWNFDLSGRFISTSAPVKGEFSVLNADSLTVVRKWTVPAKSANRLLENGQTLAIAMPDHSISLFNVESGRKNTALYGHSDIVTCIVKMPNQEILVSGSRDRTVRLWNLESMEEMTELRGHLDAVNALAVTPDGRTMFSASGDYTIRRWSAKPMRELLQARMEYREISARLALRINELFARLGTAAAVAERFESDVSLSRREREIALQLIFKKSVEDRG